MVGAPGNKQKGNLTASMMFFFIHDTREYLRQGSWSSGRHSKTSQSNHQRSSKRKNISARGR